MAIGTNDITRHELGCGKYDFLSPVTNWVAALLIKRDHIYPRAAAFLYGNYFRRRSIKLNLRAGGLEQVIDQTSIALGPGD